MTPQLLAMVLLGLQANFADYELWLPNGGDIIIVAAKSARVPRLDAAAFGNAALASDLARVQIRNMDDLRLHRMSGRGALAPYFALLAVEPNSDFFPVLDLDAPRARFIGASAGDLTLLYETGIPLFELFDGQAAAPDPARISAGARPWLARAAYADQAGALAHFLRHANPAALAPLGSFLASDAILLRAALVDCRLSLPPSALSSALANVAVFVNQHLPRAEREKFWKPLQSSDCAGSRVPGSQEWLRLYAAIGAAHPLGMAETAGRLLDRASELPRELVATALAARMAGLILSGQPVEARRAFAAHRTRVPDGRSYQVMFRFLIAQTDAPLVRVIDADVTKTVSLAKTGRQAKVSSVSQAGIKY
jgi:hypothetical protein